MGWPPKRQQTQDQRAEANGYRSGLEEKIAADLKNAGIDAKFEAVTIKYTKPSKVHRYTPDFILPNGIIIETKGRFVTADRTKHRLLREQYPHLDIRFVFSRSKDVIGKKSTTTYALWCQRLSILFADRSIPDAWLREKPCSKRLAAIEALTS
jgi:hypothetical protein